MLAANTTEGRKARQLLRKRQKGSFSFLAHHQADPDIVVQLKRMHFQDGRAAYQYMDGAYRTPIDNIALKQMDKDFDALDLLETVGVNEHTITLIVKVMRVLNAKRPIANQKDETEMTEKLLEMIYTTSKHFSENATLEYNKAAGQRAFEHVPPHPLAGQRNFRACEQHYSTLWSQAFRSKLPGFAHMPPTKRPAEPTRNTLESGMAARDAREEANLLDSGAGVGFASRRFQPKGPRFNGKKAVYGAQRRGGAGRRRLRRRRRRRRRW
jgi:hypothetical protein